MLKVKWRSYKSFYLGKRPLQNLAVNSGFYLPPAVPQQSLPSPHLKGSIGVSSGEPQRRVDFSLVGGPPGWSSPELAQMPWVAAGYTAHSLLRGPCLDTAAVLGFISSYYRKSLVRYYKHNKITFLKWKWEPKLLPNVVSNLVEKGWLRKTIQTPLRSALPQQCT